MRQAKRYLDSHQPSTRIVNQKLERIRDKQEELKLSHYAYCDKANIEINSDEAMTFLRGILDTAEDAIDECTLFLDSRDFDDQEEVRKADEALIEAEKKRRSDSQYQRAQIEVSIDERVAKDLCQKINDVVVNDEVTSTNAALVRTYLDGLEDISRVLHNSWK